MRVTTSVFQLVEWLYMNLESLGSLLWSRTLSYLKGATFRRSRPVTTLGVSMTQHSLVDGHAVSVTFVLVVVQIILAKIYAP